MTITIEKPICAICGRGKRYDLPGSTETFVLVPSEIKKDGQYQGYKYNILCGKCIIPILRKRIDCFNLIVSKSIQINIDGKSKSLEVLP